MYEYWNIHMYGKNYQHTADQLEDLPIWKLFVPGMWWGAEWLEVKDLYHSTTDTPDIYYNIQAKFEFQLFQTLYYIP